MDKEILKNFQELDTSEYPDFYGYKIVLDRALWILWIAKDKLENKKLTAEEICEIIREVKNIKITPRSITNSFNRARDKIDRYVENGEIYYKITKDGIDYLNQAKKGEVNIFYFEPEKRYTSKYILSKDILHKLKGEIKIVDPYISERTLDILKDSKNQKIKFLTRLNNIRKESIKNSFLNALKDFKSEFPDIEFRDYLNSDIHDRYIISSDSLVILGYSIKNLGSKESFAVRLKKENFKNIYEALLENFDRRWKKSIVLC